jgi:hypothetical protein
MAEYPCDFHHDRYDGPSNRVFLNIYREDQVAALRGSVCADCLAELVTDWLGKALIKAEQGFWMRPDPEDTLESAWRARSGLTNGAYAERRR